MTTTSSKTVTGAVAIERLIEPAIAAAGFDIVRVQFMGAGGQTLQIMVERRDRGQVLVDDCAEVSRLVSAILDVDDPVPGSYVLEVSSPGIDRPLVRLADFERFAGFVARIEMAQPVDGRRRLTGLLRGVCEGSVLVDCDGETWTAPFDGIRRAALVVTDDLIAAAEREAAGGRKEG